LISTQERIGIIFVGIFGTEYDQAGFGDKKLYTIKSIRNVYNGFDLGIFEVDSRNFLIKWRVDDIDFILRLIEIVDVFPVSLYDFWFIDSSLLEISCGIVRSRGADSWFGSNWCFCRFDISSSSFFHASSTIVIHIWILLVEIDIVLEDSIYVLAGVELLKLQRLLYISIFSIYELIINCLSRDIQPKIQGHKHSEKKRNFFHNSFLNYKNSLCSSVKICHRITSLS
jgi:hypothetical protein